MQPPSSAVPILERLIKRTDLPSDVVATLQIAAEVAAFAETQQYQKGFAAGRADSPTETHPCWGRK